MKPQIFGLMAALLLGCAPTDGAGRGAAGQGGAADGGDIATITLPEGQSPPQVAGECWASDTAPAVIETITTQVQSRPERRDPATGTVTQAAQFETKIAQRLVQDRRIVWFRAPCPEGQTVAFVASLQRALKARGHFGAAVTGAWDDATAEALRAYQAQRGLDSARPSLEALRSLGLAEIAAPHAN